MVSWLKSTWGLIKANPVKVFVIAAVVAIFAGGAIAAGYNKLRAAVPGGSKLPAPRI